MKYTKSALLALALACLTLTACKGGKPNANTGSATLEIDGLARGMGLETDFTEEGIVDDSEEIDRAFIPVTQNVLTKADGTELRSDAYLYRETLPEMLQAAYDQIRGGIADGMAQIPITATVTKDEFRDVYKAVYYDSPDLFFWAGGVRFGYNSAGYITKVMPEYNEFGADIAGNISKLDNVLAAPLADMMNLASDADKVKYAHDYLVSHVEYDYNAPHAQTVYGALIDGKCVCAGYARAFQYMMQKAGIRCGYISGTSMNELGSGAHAWNIVELENEFYVMDVTWDDPIGGEAGKVYYDYYNVTDEGVAGSHARDALSMKLPVAMGTRFKAAW